MGYLEMEDHLWPFVKFCITCICLCSGLSGAIAYLAFTYSPLLWLLVAILNIPLATYLYCLFKQAIANNLDDSDTRLSYF